MRNATFAASLVVVSRLFAVSVPPAFLETPLPAAAEPPLRAASLGAEVIVSLDEMPLHHVQALRDEEGSGGPRRIGIVRALDHQISIAADRAYSGYEPWRWRGAVHVAGATSVRIRLEDLVMPPDARFWVYPASAADPAVAFDMSIAHGASLWTPSVFGDTAVLEVESPNGGAFRISSVADMRHHSDIVPLAAACVRDASCQNSSTLEDYASSTAHMRYISGGSAWICSGGLIIDRAQTFTPYFLTANHCISTGAEAASLETYWDYRTSFCNGSAPSLLSVPRILGASLLTTSESADMTLLRLAREPFGARWYMGWTTSSVTAGTQLYRISYPEGRPQSYSVTKADPLSRACLDTPHTRYLYSAFVYGGTAGGSSGSPAFNETGHIVGQLFGSCGGADDCDLAKRTVDGKLSSSWPLLQPYLDPQTSGCTATSTTVCLLSNRFRVSIRYKNPFSNPPGQPGNFLVARLNASATNPDVAIFGFDSAQNVEIVVRLLDARPYAPRFDVFYGGLTDVEYWVTVTDTITGRSKEYYNPPLNVGGGVDRTTFPAQ